MTKRHSYEYVQSVFEERGYKLLSTEYKNNKQDLEYVCPEHPNIVTKTRFNSIVSGQGCPHCAGNVRFTFSEVKGFIESEGHRLLSDSYGNNHTKLVIKCPKHENDQFQMTFKDFKKGHRCPKCKAEALSKRTRGDKHYAWKGASELTFHLRAHTKEWTLEVLRAHRFVCDITGENNGDLEVHHLIPFNIIRDEALRELSLGYRERIGDYTSDELYDLVELVKRKHPVENGVPLSKGIHNLFHRLYGNRCTPYDYYEFKQRYLSGELQTKPHEELEAV